jgi:hypothetical protein
MTLDNAQHEFRTTIASTRAWLASGGTQKHVIEFLAAHNHLQGHVRVVITPTEVRLEEPETPARKSTPGLIERMVAAVDEELQSNRL